MTQLPIVVKVHELLLINDCPYNVTPIKTFNLIHITHRLTYTAPGVWGDDPQAYNTKTLVSNSTIGILPHTSGVVQVR